MSPHNFGTTSKNKAIQMKRDFLNLLPSCRDSFAGTLSKNWTSNNLDFSMLAAGHSVLKRNTCQSNRKLSAWAICAILKGTGYIYWNNKKRQIKPGIGYIIPPHLSFSEEADSKDDWHSMDIQLIPSANIEFLSDKNYKDTITFFKVPINMIQEMVNLAWVLYLKETNFALKAYGIYYQIMAELKDLLSGALMCESDIAQRAYCFMKNHLHETIAVGMLAQYCHLSTSAFATRFRRETGMSPIAAFTHEKIREAKVLLARGKNVGEVAEILGFNNQFYFSRVFRRIEGISPQKFKSSLFRLPH